MRIMAIFNSLLAFWLLLTVFISSRNEMDLSPGWWHHFKGIIISKIIWTMFFHLKYSLLCFNTWKVAISKLSEWPLWATFTFHLFFSFSISFTFYKTGDAFHWILYDLRKWFPAGAVDRLGQRLNCFLFLLHVSILQMKTGKKFRTLIIVSLNPFFFKIREVKQTVKHTIRQVCGYQVNLWKSTSCCKTKLTRLNSVQEMIRLFFWLSLKTKEKKQLLSFIW